MTTTSRTGVPASAAVSTSARTQDGGPAHSEVQTPAESSAGGTNPDQALPGRDDPHVRTPGGRLRGMTARGAYLVMVAISALGCGLGFILGGAVAIPSLAGWGLVAGAVIAGLLGSPRAGWFPVALPPLAMLTVIGVLGQLTLIGSRPTLVREFAMVVSNLTATAPAQVAGVAAVAAILFARQRAALRRSELRRGQQPGDVTEYATP